MAPKKKLPDEPAGFRFRNNTGQFPADVAGSVGIMRGYILFLIR